MFYNDFSKAPFNKLAMYQLADGQWVQAQRNRINGGCFLTLQNGRILDTRGVKVRGWMLLGDGGPVADTRCCAQAPFDSGGVEITLTCNLEKGHEGLHFDQISFEAGIKPTLPELSKAGPQVTKEVKEIPKAEQEVKPLDGIPAPSGGPQAPKEEG